MFEGKYDDKCSVYDFLSHMPTGSASKVPCQEVLRQKRNKQLRVFWYPGAGTNEPCRNPIQSAFGRSVPETIKRFLEFLPPIWENREFVMVQFWTPKRSSTGRTVLTVSEQPCAVNRPLYRGLCRYRYHCIQQEIDLTGEIGPIGRVFNQGSHEYCQNIESYTIQEFPMRNFAKCCGIKQFHAFPVFEHSDGDRQCVGVLEYVSRSESIYYHSLFPESLEDMPDLRATGKHFLERCKARKLACESLFSGSMVGFVMSKHGLPLIQIWAPSLCGEELLCNRMSFDKKLKGSFNYDYLFSYYGAHSVKNGEGLVGRAYLQTRCCFFEDTSRFSISDYPLVHITRSLNLTACFAIPLQSIHPNIHPLIMLAFLPPQQNCDHRNLEVVLKSILSTVAQELSRSEEYYVEFSNSDEENFVFFDVHQSCKTSYSTIIEEENHMELFQLVPGLCGFGTPIEGFLGTDILNPFDDIPIHVQEYEVAVENHDGDQYLSHEALRCSQTHATLESNDHFKSITEDTVNASGECFANADVEISLEAIPIGEEEIFDGELVTSHETMGDIKKDQQLGTLETKDHLINKEYMADDSRKPCITDGNEITLDIINQYLGRANLDDAANKMKVSRSTLKRRCRALGIKRWPFFKRNEVSKSNSNAGLPETSLVEVGGRVIQEHEISRCSNNSKAEAASIPEIANEHEPDRGYRMIVKASYGDDVAKFPFYSNSGIEELHRGLDKRFKLEVGRFKIKYKDEDDDGEWIILSCDEDLVFYMENLKSSGQSTIKLSVFPVTL